MDINNIIAPVVNQPKPAPKADTPLPKPAASAPAVPAPAPKVDTVSKDLERARIERVQAALESIRNTYAVSDSRFTLFKDSTGDIVTKVTSLRDGSVSYFPEKTLYELAAARNARFAEISASLDTSA